MAYIPEFGMAVHAVIPFLKAYPGNVKTLTLGDRHFYAIIRNFGRDDKYGHDIPMDSVIYWLTTPELKTQIIRAWNAILRVIQEADECWLEPALKHLALPGEPYYMPDLTRRLGRRIEVIDVKTSTYLPDDFLQSFNGQKLVKQVRFVANVLKRQSGDGYEIVGRGLVFPNRDDLSPSLTG